MSWTVTRQVQWPEGSPVVEISAGGIDYTNPDALSKKYPGEFNTFDDPREAVKTAIGICRSWRRDGETRARIAHGATGGMTMPFEAGTFKEAEAWAAQLYEKLDKCDHCGGVLPKHYWHNDEVLPDQKFCSEYCAEKAAAAEEEFQASLKKEEEVSEE